MDKYCIRNIKLQADSYRPSPTKVEFSGVMSSLIMNTQKFRMSDKTLSELVKQANVPDLKVRYRHSTYIDPIGHSLSARRKGSEALVDFVVVKDVKNPDTNDILYKMQNGILDSLSTGTIGGRFKCDLCSSFFKAESDGWFFYKWVCSEGHVMGRRAEGGKEVTAELVHSIQYPIRLLEYSVCPTGANPNAKLLEDINRQFLSGDIGAGEIELMAALNDIPIHDFSTMLEDAVPGTQIAVGIAFPKGEPMSTPTTINPIPEGLELSDPVINNLHEHIVQRDEKIAELEAKLAETPPERFTAMEQENQKLRENVQTLEIENEQNAKMVEVGTKVMEDLRTSGQAALRDRFGANYQNDPEGKRYLADMNDETLTYESLKSKVESFWVMARAEKPIGKQTSTPISRVNARASYRHPSGGNSRV